VSNEIRKVAREMRAAMVHKVREDKSVFFTLRDDAPDWCRDVACEAHGDLLPDDHRYELIASALEAIRDGEATDDDHHEWCDSMVDVYRGARARWLASSPYHRESYCDEAASEGLIDRNAGIWDRLGAGQFLEAQETFGLLWNALARRAEEIDSEDES